MTQVHRTIELTGCLKRITILMVDNDQMIVDLMTRVLKHLGFQDVYGATDGFSAVRVMYQHEIDIVITDWELHPMDEDYLASLPTNAILRSDRWLPVPPKDGASFVRYLRASRYSPNPYVPVIMLTGLGLQDHVQYARDVGVNEMVLKPVSIEDLCDRIAMLVDQPRCFITARSYKGPCRRREAKDAPPGEDRRKMDIKVFKHAG